MSSTQSMTFDTWFNTNYGQIAGVLPLEPKLRLLVKAQMRIAWMAALVLNGQVNRQRDGEDCVREHLQLRLGIKL